MYLTIIPAVLIIRRGLKNRVVIRINKQGLFYYNSKITDWSNLLEASISEYMEPGDINSRFVLILILREFNNNHFITYKIPLASTFDRDGDEIIAAINYFDKICKSNAQI